MQQLRGPTASAASPQYHPAEPSSLNSEAHPPTGNDPPASDFDEQAFRQQLLAELGRAPSTSHEGQLAPGNPVAAEDQHESGRESGFTPTFTRSSPAHEFTAACQQKSAGAFTPSGDTVNNIDAASFFSDEAMAMLQDPFLPMPSSWVPNQEAYGMASFNGDAGSPGSLACSNVYGTQYLPFVSVQQSYQPNQAYQLVDHAAGFEDDAWYGELPQSPPAAPAYQNVSFPVLTLTAPVQSRELIDLTEETDNVLQAGPTKKRKRPNDDVGKEDSSFKKQALAFQPSSHPRSPPPPPPPPSKPIHRRQLKGHRHIEGFPPADSPLPPNLDFCTILHDYPNHVHGPLILRMNREGDYSVPMMREASKCLVSPNPKNKENPKGVYVLEEKELKNRLASARPRLDPEGKGSKRKRRRRSDEDGDGHGGVKGDDDVVESSSKRAKVDDKDNGDGSSRRSSIANAQYPTPPKTVPSSPIVATTSPQTPAEPSTSAPAPAPLTATTTTANTTKTTTPGMTSSTCLNLQTRMHDFLHHHFLDHMMEINLNKTYKKKTNAYTNAIHKYAEEMIERQERIAKGEVVERQEPVRPKASGCVKGAKGSGGEKESVGGGKYGATHRHEDDSMNAVSGKGSNISPVVVKVDRKRPSPLCGYWLEWY